MRHDGRSKFVLGATSLGFLLLASCGSPTTGTESSALSSNFCLSLELVNQDVSCPHQSGVLELDYTVESTHGTAAATVTASIDGGAAVTIGSIATSDWTVSGGIEKFSGTANLSLDDGSHTIALCVVQGTNHQCNDAFTVDVECEKPKCNQGVGNGPEGCDPGNSDNHNPSNDENGGTPGDPGRAHKHHTK